jgi:transcriptional regulator with XRE-family HTH domain
MSKEELIKQLVQARKDKNISQKDLSELLGISQQRISKIENENDFKELDFILNYTQALGLKIEIKK